MLVPATSTLMITFSSRPPPLVFNCQPPFRGLEVQEGKSRTYACFLTGATGTEQGILAAWRLQLDSAIWYYQVLHLPLVV